MGSSNNHKPLPGMKSKGEIKCGIDCNLVPNIGGVSGNEAGRASKYLYGSKTQKDLPLQVNMIKTEKEVKKRQVYSLRICI